eukprot:6957877-Pyramimonas_sp.AAC.1
MEDPERREEFRLRLQKHGSVRWNVDVNVQYKDVVGVVKKEAAAVFGRDLLAPHQPYISRNTMQLIRLRRYAVIACRKFHRKEPRAFSNLCLFLPAQFHLYANEGDPWYEESQRLLLGVGFRNAEIWGDA